MFMERILRPVSREIFELGIPILGICYGSQLMAHLLGGKVTTLRCSEYGKTEVEVDNSSVLFEDVSPKTDLLDEPYRLYCKGSGRFPCDGPYPGLPGGCHGKCGEEAVCGTVPSGGNAYPGRHENAVQFRI